MTQVFNPFLPENEYIPDPEVHVFGDRVFLYGSHDQFNGEDYCVDDYVCWSAAIENLKEWKYEGVIYKKEDHPGNKGNLYAPDVAKGIDGRFYLYYSIADSSIISVAVSDTPNGKYEYYGDVRYKDGSIAGSKEGDYFEFDPAVLVDEDNTIYLYSGSGQESKIKHKNKKLGLFVRELEEDMLTIKTTPKLLMEADEDRQKPNFFEGASVRKIEGLYYLVYFASDISGLNYCISNYPDKDFEYKGIIHSAADIGLNDRKLSNAASQIGNNHGSIEVINGKAYVFNHRQTNKSQYSRQAVAEKIKISEEGIIEQVESTSCGLNGGPLTEKTTYPAYIACNIMDKKVDGIRNPFTAPFVSEDGISRRSYIKDIKSGCLIGYKYFEFKTTSRIYLTVRGKAKGNIRILLEEEGDAFSNIGLDIDSDDWISIQKNINLPARKIALFFNFIGEGNLDLLSFEIE